jgi:hypothetical protein
MPTEAIDAIEWRVDGAGLDGCPVLIELVGPCHCARECRGWLDRSCRDLDLAKYDIAIDRDLVYSQQAKRQVWTTGVSSAGQPFPYGLGWFVFNIGGSRMPWHYGWYPDAYSSLLFKVPDRQLTLILLACTDRASSIFWPGNGDPIRSAFVTAFLDGIVRSD